MVEEKEGAEWGDIWTTMVLRRSDSERLKKLARPRKNKKPYERKLHHKYEVLTHALDALERERAKEE